MREAGFLHLLIEDIVTPKRVEHHLDRFKPHIVHYIGHGDYDQASGGTLLWEDDQGNTLPLSALSLASLLRSRNLHGVVLHGCETGRSNARAEIQSLAGILVQEGLPAILAQQANFTYESSPLASRAWYKGLVTGKSMAGALLAVRQKLIEADRPDWAVPILQGSTASLTPVLDATSIPGPPDPLLTRRGAAADLPTPTDVFVGRHRELRALHLMLEDVSESGPVLALITGPGGMGKSTLALQAVTRYGGSYKAALMLRCQGYQGIDLFLQSIGELLKRLDAPLFLEHTLPDPKLSTEAKIDEVAIAFNAVGPVLLVIDNLESVQDENQRISDKAFLYLLQKLLTNLRGGRVLITGRYMVKELLSQENVRTKFLHLGLEDLSPYETSQLLLRYPPLAKLDEIVRKKLAQEFGGLPYVYHLLSSQAAVENLEQIIYEVRDYGAVKQKMITEERKQRTAKEWQRVHSEIVEFATLEVIVNRLSEGARTLLAQLSVLRQPFPLAAIEEGLEAVPTVWQSLLDWSLLHYDLYEKDYHLHNLTRRYAEGLLEEQPRQQVQSQLASWYEHYAAQNSHRLADYLEAHRLFRAAGRVQQAGQLVMQLAETLRRFGLYPLLCDLCTKTLSDIRASDERLTVSTLDELGKIASLQGEYEQAHSLYQQSLEMAERLGDQSGQAGCLHQLGMIAQEQGKYEDARCLYQQSLEITEILGNQNGRATTLHALGTIAQDQGEYEQAHRLYELCLDIFERLRDQGGQARTLYQLGMIAQDQGEYEQACRLLQQSLSLFAQLGNQRGQASSLHVLGVIAQDQGEYEQAHRLYQKSLDIFEHLGDQKRRTASLHSLGNLAYLQGKYQEARGFYKLCLEMAERLGDRGEQAGCLHQLGMIAQDQGEYKEAHRLYELCLDIFEHLGDQNGQAMTLYGLGTIVQEQGEYEEAHRLYQKSLNIFERLGNQRGQASVLHQFGVIAQRQGKYEEAHRLYQKSLNTFERLGNQKECHSSGLLARLP
jgi:tetratricopeptide (TPR) repeat protein